jgi:hypothetical protein
MDEHEAALATQSDEDFVVPSDNSESGDSDVDEEIVEKSDSEAEAEEEEEEEEEKIIKKTSSPSKRVSVTVTKSQPLSKVAKVVKVAKLVKVAKVGGEKAKKKSNTLAVVPSSSSAAHNKERRRKQRIRAGRQRDAKVSDVVVATTMDQGEEVDDNEGEGGEDTKIRELSEAEGEGASVEKKEAKKKDKKITSTTTTQSKVVKDMSATGPKFSKASFHLGDNYFVQIGQIEVRGKQGFSYEGLIISRKPKANSTSKLFTCNIPAKLTIPLLESLKCIVEGERVQ